MSCVYSVELVDAQAMPVADPCIEHSRAAADERAFEMINEVARTSPLPVGAGLRVHVLESDGLTIRLVNVVRRPDET